jgi:integrase
MISFAVFTGCRVGEILGAAWSHIDWKSGQFHVRRAFREGQFQEPKTRTSYRRLTLPTFLLKELKVWRLACPNSPHDLVFPNLGSWDTPMRPLRSTSTATCFRASMIRAAIGSHPWFLETKWKRIASEKLD